MAPLWNGSVVLAKHCRRVGSVLDTTELGIGMSDLGTAAGKVMGYARLPIPNDTIMYWMSCGDAKKHLLASEMARKLRYWRNIKLP